MKVIILAGGRGTRLRPYTTILPKPLMPLGEKPIMEHLIGQLERQGFRDIIISVGYLAELIESYFGDGSKFGVSLSYLREETPLGTIGPLRLLDGLKNEQFLVLNGDILTDMDLDGFVNCHTIEKNMITIAAFQKEMQIDLGVLELTADSVVSSYNEKPLFKHYVSMGIYCCNSEIIAYIPSSGRFDLPELVKKMIDESIPVKVFKHDGYWFDIGRRDDYERASECFEKGGF